MNVFRHGPSTNEGCREKISGWVRFENPIINHPGPEYAFGYYYYEFYLYLWGIDSNGNHVLVETVQKDVNDYNTYGNGYSYSFHNNVSENYIEIEDLPYESYYMGFKITKIVTNNDPNMYWFFPQAHWVTTDVELEPKCGDSSCPSVFNGANNSNCENGNGGNDNGGNSGESDLVTTTNNVLVISDCDDCNITLSNLGSDKHPTNC